MVYSVSLTMLRGSQALDWLTAGLQIACNLPALVVLARGLARREAAAPVSTDDDDRLGAFLAERNLSKREVEIVRLLLRGASNKEIRGALDVSMETVKKHVYNTYRKLGVRSRLQLVVLIRDQHDLKGTGTGPA